MARTVAFIPSVAPGVTATVALDQIPEDIREEVEQAYAALKANPNGRLHAEFESEAELRQYVTYVTSYCEQRPAGAIRFRKSPTKGLPKTQMDFRITDLKTENEQVTDAIREATAKANDASGAVPLQTAAKVVKPTGRK